MKKIFIFSKATHPFAPRLQEIDQVNDYQESHYQDLEFYLPNQGKEKVIISAHKLDLKNYNCVYFRHAENFQNYATAIAQYLTTNNIKYCDSYLLNTGKGGKLMQMVLLQLHDIPTPKTIALSFGMQANSFQYLVSELGEKFIYKDIVASHGNRNYLINNEAEFNLALKDNSEIQFIAQEFIPNSFDYRFVTINGKVAVIKKRIRHSTTSHLNNHFQGAEIEIVTKEGLDDLITIAEKAASLYQTQVAGVDIVVSDTTKKPYVLEVNRAPDITDPASMAAIKAYLEE